MPQVFELLRIQFPSFPLLGDGKLGSWRQPVDSKSLRVSQRDSRFLRSGKLNGSALLTEASSDSFVVFGANKPAARPAGVE